LTPETPLTDPRAFAEWVARRQLRDEQLVRLQDAAIHGATIRERIEALRAVWGIVEPEVMACISETGHPPDPYYIDWLPVFTPIEDDAWQYIRGRGLPMLPQVPIDRFIVDFGDPAAKIAIECDGARWHSLARDGPRDQALASLGWLVFRLSGRELYPGETELGEIREQFYDSPERLAAEIEEWVSGTAAGFFHVLQSVFYRRSTLACADGTAFRTLSAHCLVPKALENALQRAAWPRVRGAGSS
jgi:very-short-patch-repair endonuclease